MFAKLFYGMICRLPGWVLFVHSMNRVSGLFCFVFFSSSGIWPLDELSMWIGVPTDEDFCMQRQSLLFSGDGPFFVERSRVP